MPSQELSWCPGEEPHKRASETPPHGIWVLPSRTPPLLGLGWLCKEVSLLWCLCRPLIQLEVHLCVRLRLLAALNKRGPCSTPRGRAGSMRAICLSCGLSCPGQYGKKLAHLDPSSASHAAVLLPRLTSEKVSTSAFSCEHNLWGLGVCPCGRFGEFRRLQGQAGP